VLFPTHRVYGDGFGLFWGFLGRFLDWGRDECVARKDGEERKSVWKLSSTGYVFAKYDVFERDSQPPIRVTFWCLLI
jgi:hypothetical protein